MVSLTVGFLRCFDVTTNKYGSKAALLKKCSWCWWCGVVTSGPTAPQHTSKLIWHLVHLSLCVVDHLFLVGHLFPAIELEGCRTCCDIGQRAIIPLFQMWRNTFQLRIFGISWNITSPDIVLPCCRETVLSPNRSYLSRCLNAASIVLPQAWPERVWRLDPAWKIRRQFKWVIRVRELVLVPLCLTVSINSVNTWGQHISTRIQAHCRFAVGTVILFGTSINAWTIEFALRYSSQNLPIHRKIVQCNQIERGL